MHTCQQPRTPDPQASPPVAAALRSVAVFPPGPASPALLTPDEDITISFSPKMLLAQVRTTNLLLFRSMFSSLELSDTNV